MEVFYLIIILLGSGKGVHHVPYATEAACTAERNKLAIELDTFGYEYVITCSKAY